MNQLSTSRKTLLAIAIILSPLILTYFVALIFSEMGMGMGAYIFILPAIFGTIPMILIGVIISIINRSVTLKAFYIPAIIIVLLIILTPLLFELAVSSFVHR